MLILGAGTVIFRFVRKHRAPKGALRLFQTSTDFDNAVLVRKHRAPKGALRLHDMACRNIKPIRSESTERQKVH